MFLRLRYALAAGLLISVVSTAVSQTDLLSNLRPRAIGPTTMGGRIADISVYEKEPRIFYVASAAGGLWKTVNAGITMEPMFDQFGQPGLGDVEVSQTNPDVVWVATGEPASRNSVSWGDGIYKSTDGGKTFTNMGLKEVQFMADIIIDPKDENTIYVAGLGPLWNPSENRGVYKSTDGGKNWTKILYVDDKTGPGDMVMNPSNPKEILVGMWQKIRYPWSLLNGGPSSAIYKTVDAGKTWKKITNGMPEGNIGRIGLDYYRKNPKVVVALIESNASGGGGGGGGVTNTGGGTYRSTDGGESWTKVNNLNPRPFYFSLPRQDPSDLDRIYVAGTNLHMSSDQGKTFTTMPINRTVHVDYHAMWIDPKDSNHIIVGNDGGLYQSRDRGVKWEHINSMVISQFYAVHYDMRKPYWVGGGLQDNQCWMAPSQGDAGFTTFSNWYNLGGGDGFFVQFDPNDWTTVYHESQGGAAQRTNLLTGESRSVRPRVAGERIRFNWSAPIALSPWVSTTVYMGSNRLMKSTSRGDSWEAISPDLTTNNPDKQRPGLGSVNPENTGAEVHCTIVTVAESQSRRDMIWVGTDDGLVHVTSDGGKTWENVTTNIPDLPEGMWCTRVMPSKFAANRCYVSFDDHRRGNFKPYLYVTEDLGKTWKKLAESLPNGHVIHCVREGTNNPNALYLGTEVGLYISVDRGATWNRLSQFPATPVHDVQVHPRDLDLILATHGRGIWTMNVSGIEAMTEDAMKADAVIGTPQNVYILPNGMQDGGYGDRQWNAQNTQPGTEIQYYLKADQAANSVKVIITDVAGNVVWQTTGSEKAGLNVVRWNGGSQGGQGRRSGRVPGEYRVTLKLGEKEFTTRVTVESLIPGGAFPGSFGFGG
ncbi:MAG: hypothetical protein KF784_09780 [Fimbriimonadaceae bacterium]|nr:hypothetical protein [Fimbriimonadaceae bacterium]